jgi:branched-chain amino acid aminotransferase
MNYGLSGLLRGGSDFCTFSWLPLHQNLTTMLLHRYFIQNGTVLESRQYQPNIGIEIYEVVRVVKGIPLFLEDHLQRFYHSAWLCHLEIPLEEEEIASMLAELIRVNGVDEGNIRFSFCFRPSGNFQAYFIPHFYPDAAMVNEGPVVCCMLKERIPMPK